MPQAKKTKICLVLHAPLGGGAEKVMMELAAHLSRAIFDIRFILFNARGEYAHLLPKDIAIIDLGMNLPGPYQLTGVNSLWKLAGALKKENPQLIFSTLGYTNLMTIIAKMFSGIEAKLIIRETTVLSVYLQTDKFSAFKSFLYKKFYPQADAVIGPSQAVLEDLVKFIPFQNRRPQQVIPNFINPQAIEAALSQKWDAQTYHLKTDKPVIISVGHLEKIKGIDFGLRAFAQLNKDFPAYYWILGSGSQEQQLRKLSVELGITESVFFSGFQKNPYIFLKNADIFFLPSRFEGFPNALLEAMYVGLPGVVTQYNASITDFFKDGEEGFIVPPDDVNAAARALGRLLQDHPLKDNMAIKAKKRAGDFDIRHFVAQYEEFFQRLV